MLLEAFGVGKGREYDERQPTDAKSGRCRRWAAGLDDGPGGESAKYSAFGADAK